MRKFYLSVFVVILSCFMLLSQSPVRLGSHVLDLKGQTASSLSRPETRTGPDSGESFVLVQFRHVPTSSDRANLESQGIRLLDYAGANAYFAVISHDKYRAQPTTRSATSLIVGSTDMLGKYKLSDQMLKGEIPDYARSGLGALVYIHVRKDKSLSDLKNDLSRFGERVKYTNAESSDLGVIRVEILPSDYLAIADLPSVQLINYVEMPYEPQNHTGVPLQRSNVLNLGAELGGLGLQGEGVRVGVWDGNVQEHVDYGHRVHQRESGMGQNDAGGHGMHVTGTILGSGLLDPLARGNAPKAEAYTYNFNVQANGLPAFIEMAQSYEQEGIRITQNSYGPPMRKLCQYLDIFSYNALGSDIGLDKLAFLAKNLTHVFAAGNDQGACGRLYGSTLTRIKNAILVGAADYKENISDFSSFGPMDDGRLIPTVTSYGVNVYSTIFDNGYTHMSGTSMATPNVTGAVTLLTQRFKQVNGGVSPNSDFMRGLVTVSARDKGNPGPDYVYGYGVMDAFEAVSVIDHKQWKSLKLSTGEEQTFTITNIPSTAKRVRVMLSWTDPVAERQYALGEKALINDFDLEVNGQLPWILDPQNPSRPAKRGVDDTNNLEMVTIDNPGGSLEVTVKGKKLPLGNSECVVLWYYEDSTPRLTYPLGNEMLASGEELVVRWNGTFDGPALIELSTDGGKTYKSLTRVSDGNQGSAVVTLEEGLFTKEARIRVSGGSKVTSSKGNFTIAPVVQNLKLISTTCAQDGGALSWDAVPGADHYQVCKIDKNTESYVVVQDNLNSTTVAIDPSWLVYGEVNAFTVRAVKGDVVGRTAKGALFTAASPVTIKGISLPFHEGFRQTPSPYFAVDVPPTYSSFYADDLEGLQLRPGDRPFAMRPSNMMKDWTPETAWDDFKYVSLTNCSMTFDPSMKDKDPILTLIVAQIPKDKPSDVMVRVLIDDQVVKDLRGRSVVSPTSTQLELANIGYDMKSFCDGKVHRLEIQASCNIGSVNAFIAVIIDKANVTSNPVLQGADVEHQDPKDYTSQETLSLRIMNPSVRTLKNFTVSCQVTREEPALDGGVVKTTFDPITETISRNIAPYENFDFVLQNKFDLTTENEIGAIFKLNFTAYFEGGDPNGYPLKEQTFYNYGKVYRLPLPIKQLLFGFIPFWTDPKDIQHVDHKFLFTDDGGAIANATISSNSPSTVLFLPKDPNKVVKVTFLKNADFTDLGKNQLGVLGASAPSELEYSSSRFKPKYFDAVLNSDTEFPFTVIGANKDGSVMVRSTNQDASKGWIATVEEIERGNLFKIETEPYIQTSAETVTIKAKVTNLTSNALDKLTISCRSQLSAEIDESIVIDLPANGSKEITFSKPIPVAKDANTEVFVFSLDYEDQDTEADDNFIRVLVTSSDYCTPVMKDNVAKAEAQSMECGEGRVDLKADQEDAITFALTRILTVNADIDNVLQLTTTSKVQKAKLWIDWNRNNVFDAGESLELFMEEKGLFKRELNVPQAVEDGDYRMRIIASSSDITDPCAEIKDGSAIDVTLRYHRQSPIQTDLEIVEILEPVGGMNLSSASGIAFTVKNNSHKDAQGFDVSIYKRKDGKLFSDANLVAVEHVDSIIPAGKTRRIPLKTTVDLSEVGSHVLGLALADDDNNDNNKSHKVVENILKANNAGGYYAEFVGNRVFLVPDGNEEMTSITYELWIKPDLKNAKKQNNIFMGTNMMLGYFPNGMIFVGVFKSNKIANDAYTTPNVLKDGEWQHLAVSFTNDEEPILYINGKPVSFARSGGLFKEWKIGNNDPYDTRICFGLNAAFDEARLWNKARTRDEIREGMNKHFTTKDATSDREMGLIWEYQFDEGPGNNASLYFDKVAQIRYPKDANPDENVNFWRPYNKLFKKASFATQTIEPQMIGTDGSEYKVLLKPGSDRTQVASEFYGLWDDCEMSIENGPSVVDHKAVLDLTKDFVLKIRRRIFGEYVVQFVTFRVEEDKKDASHLTFIRFDKKDNNGLSEDLVYNDPAQSLVAQIDPNLVPMVAPVLGLPEGATATINGKPYEPGKNFVSTKENLLIEVTAENGRDRSLYIVSFGNTNVTISWDDAQTTSVLVNESIALAATASNGASVSFYSMDNEIATVVDGKLLGLKIGTVDVIASTEGAPSVRKTFTVTPKEIHINNVLAFLNNSGTKVLVAPHITFPNRLIDPKTKESTYFRMDNLIPVLSPRLTSNKTLSVVGHIKEKEIYSIVLEGSGKIWTPEDGNLPIGTHKIVPSVKEEVFGNYKLVYETRDLKVVKAADETLVTRKIKVVNSSNGPVQGATVLDVNRGTSYLTDANGLVELTLTHRDGDTTPMVFRAYHDTYGNSMEVEYFTKDADWETKPLVLIEASISLRFVPSDPSMGVVLGETVQRIAEGSMSTEVLASPITGYKFVSWSGPNGFSSTSPNIKIAGTPSNSGTYTASFAPFTYVVKYEVEGQGGHLEGVLVQDIGPKTEGTPVKAVADPGYVFYQWSDERKDNPRMDKNVTANKTIKAEFIRQTTLPYSENFETTKTKPAKGFTIENPSFASQTDKSRWVFRVRPYVDLPESYYMVYEANVLVKNDLRAVAMLPTISLTDSDKTKPLAVQFDAHVSSGIPKDFVSMYYRSNIDSKWTKLVTLENSKSYTLKTYVLSLPIDVIKNMSVIEFAFIVDKVPSTNAWLVFGDVSIDNIKIWSEDLSNRRWIYTAENGGLILTKGETVAKNKVELKAPKEVTAVPNPGYVFDTWSDGVKDATRKDELPVDVKASFRKAKIYDLPYKQDFESKSLPADFTVTGHRYEDGYKRVFNIWEINKPSIKWPELARGNETYMAAVHANRFSSQPDPNTDLITPQFNLTDAHRADGVNYAFEYYFKNRWKTIEFIFYYKTDVDNDWVEVKHLEPNAPTGFFDHERTGSKNFSGKVDVKQSAKTIQFKFKALATEGSSEGLIFVDNLSFGGDAQPVTKVWKYTAGDGGHVKTASGSPVKLLELSAAEEVTAVAESGYKFVSWSDGIKTASRTDVDGAEVKATFAKEDNPQPAVYRYVAGEGGHVQTAGGELKKELLLSSPEAVTAVADAGYAFIGWSDGVQSATRTDANYVDVKASFVKKNVVLRVYHSSTGGFLRVSDGREGQTFTLESPLSVEAVANTGYVFVDWSDGLRNPVRSDKDAVDVTARFRAKDYILTYDSVVRGIELKAYVEGAYVPSGTSLSKGTEVEVRATQTGESSLSYWTLNGNQVTNDANQSVYKFTVMGNSHVSVVTNNSGVRISFRVNELEGLTKSATVNGVALDESKDYPVGSKASFHVNLPADAKVLYWKVNGVVVTEKGTSLYLVADKDLQVECRVTKPSYRLTYTVDQGAQIRATVSGEMVGSGVPVLSGKEVTIQVFPNGDAVTDVWFVNGKALGLNQGDNTYTFTMNEDTDVRVTLLSHPTRLLFTTQLNGGLLHLRTADGKVLTSGTYVSEGTSLELEAVPSAGYAFEAFYVNGVRQKVVSTRATGHTLKVTAKGQTMSFDASFTKTTGVEGLVEGEVQVSPNPFRTEFSLRGVSTFATYVVVDAQGTMVLRGSIDARNEVRVDGARLMPGVYLVVLERADGSRVVRKLIKQ